MKYCCSFSYPGVCPHDFYCYNFPMGKTPGGKEYSFELFKKYRKNISSITFWNISDRNSWLDNFPVRGRKDYPLLFDAQLKPKKAYWEIVK